MFGKPAPPKPCCWAMAGSPSRSISAIPVPAANRFGEFINFEWLIVIRKETAGDIAYYTPAGPKITRNWDERPMPRIGGRAGPISFRNVPFESVAAVGAYRGSAIRGILARVAEFNRTR